MIENGQAVATIVLAVISALGIREFAPVILAWIRGRKKDSAELASLSITNADASLTTLQKALQAVEAITAKSQEHLAIISELRQEKRQDDRTMERQKGVIEYQREDNDRLWAIISELRASEDALKIRVGDLEKRISDLEQDKAKLIGMKAENTTLVSENMQMKAILKTLRLQGKWDGADGIHITL